MVRNRHAVGLTLLELLVAIIIVAILVTVGLSTYRRMMERAYRRQAWDLLLTMYSGERAYFLVNDVYRANPAGMAQWREIHMDDPNLAGIPVTFTVTAAGAPGPTATFEAKATRTAGPCSGNIMTVDQDRLRGGDWGTCGAIGPF